MARRMGNPNFGRVRNKDTTAANLSRKEKADVYALKIGRILNDYSSQGFSKNRMAQELNKDWQRTIRGKLWTAMAVTRLFKRLEEMKLRLQKN